MKNASIFRVFVNVFVRQNDKTEVLTWKKIRSLLKISFSLLFSKVEISVQIGIMNSKLSELSKNILKTVKNVQKIKLPKAKIGIERILNFLQISRQNESRSVLFSLNVNKVSRIYPLFLNGSTKND